MSKKIIAISSTHGCGKSTLAYLLCARMKTFGKNVVVLDELARRCPFEINKKSSGTTEVWLLCKQIIEELELMKSFEYIIVDRGILDTYCYALCLGHYEIKDYEDLIINHIKKYYYKIYVPHKDSFNYQIPDGTRDLDPVFRDEVYEIITETYARLKRNFGIDYRIITMESVNEVCEDMDL
jgi:thymidylate kinase